MCQSPSRVMPGFHHSVAVLPFPLHKFRENYVSAVRITLPTWKIPLRRCRCHLPLRLNRRSVAIGSNPIFCRSAVRGHPISVLVTSSLCIRKDVSSISVLTCNGNGSYGTEERQRYNGTSQRHNGMVETRHNSASFSSSLTDTSVNRTSFQSVQISVCLSVGLSLGI